MCSGLGLGLVISGLGLCLGLMGSGLSFGLGLMGSGLGLGFVASGLVNNTELGDHQQSAYMIVLKLKLLMTQPRLELDNIF